jgi:hypothetical protein
MLDLKKVTAVIPTLLLATLTMGSILISSTTYGDDAPPPGTAPAPEGGGRHHDDPAWAACKKQADDQKMAPGDARRDFMKNCVKSAHAAAPAPATP